MIRLANINPPSRPPTRVPQGNVVPALVALVAVGWLIGTFIATPAPFRPPANDAANYSLLAPNPAPTDWPWLRGPLHSGVAPAGRAPQTWSAGEQVAWRISLAGVRHSSPIVCGPRVWMTVIETTPPQVALLSFDLVRGDLATSTILTRDPSPRELTPRTPAAPSPAGDGELVFVPFEQHQRMFLAAVDRAGNVRWQQECGPAPARQPSGASPVVCGPLVILACESRGQGLVRWATDSSVVALHRQTGHVVWRIPRPAADPVATPVLATLAGRSQLVLAGRRGVDSFNPTTGEPLWNVRWSAQRGPSAVTFHDSEVFVSSRLPQAEVVAIRADGSGDVTETHVVWRQNQVASEGPAPIVSGDELLVLEDQGALSCLALATGELRWRKRLTGRFAASPTLIGDALYCSNTTGTTYVLRPAERGELLAENLLHGGAQSSLAVSGDRLLLQCGEALYCLQQSSILPVVARPTPDRAVLR